ncbi:hypothetical protein BKA70DRAFT_1069657, partial [Coprinopsis sp. MPI-PUGE-AT-0042]
IATATAFFRRFYLKNSYCPMGLFFVISARLYIADTAEEFPVRIRDVPTEASSMSTR